SQVVDVHQVPGRGEAEVHERDQDLAAGQHLCLLAQLRQQPGRARHIPPRAACPWAAPDATRASTAAVKRAIAGRTSPAPTCPVPATRPAMPVLMIGAMPGRTTERTSMPNGTPRDPSPGRDHRGCSATVAWYISSVQVRASSTSPPTRPTMAGVPAMANPPRPTV